MNTLADEIARVKNELTNLSFKLCIGISFDEFLKKLIDEVEKKYETRTK